MTEERRFPVFSAAATQHGVCSSLGSGGRLRPPHGSEPLLDAASGVRVRPGARNRRSARARDQCAVSARKPGDRCEPYLARVEADGARVRAALELLMRWRRIDRAAAFAVFVADSRARDI